ncbi:Cofactor [Aix galericulata]|nr:Cofactor [Aix galericulata]
MAHGVLSPGVNLEASQAITAIQALCSSMKRVFDCLKVGTWNKEMLEGCEKGSGAAFQESLRSLSHNLGCSLKGPSSYPCQTGPMLLGKVLKATVVTRSLFIDRAIVKGYNENVYTNGKLDIWSQSNHQVFQKVMDHAITALLPYQLPWMPDVVVRSSVTWLRSYIKLFQAPCQRCRKFLQDGLLPEVTPALEVAEEGIGIVVAEESLRIEAFLERLVHQPRAAEGPCCSCRPILPIRPPAEEDDLAPPQGAAGLSAPCPVQPQPHSQGQLLVPSSLPASSKPNRGFSASKDADWLFRP